MTAIREKLRWRHGFRHWDQGVAVIVVLAIIAAALCLLGCQSNGPAPIISDAGSVGENLRGAQWALEKAEPHTSQGGKPYIEAGLQSTERGQVNLRKVIDELRWYVGNYWTSNNELNAIKSGWGYRLQVFVNRVKWILIAALSAAFLAIAINPAGWIGTAGKLVFGLMLPKFLSTPLEVAAVKTNAGVVGVLAARRSNRRSR